MKSRSIIQYNKSDSMNDDSTKSKQYARFIPRAFVSFDREESISIHLEKTKTNISGSGYIMFRANDCYTGDLPRVGRQVKKIIYELVNDGIAQSEVIGFLSNNGVLYVDRKELHYK